MGGGGSGSPIHAAYLYPLALLEPKLDVPLLPAEGLLLVWPGLMTW